MIDISDPTIMGIVAGSIGILGFFVKRQFTKIDKLSENKADKQEIKELVETKLEVLRVQDAELKEDVKEIKSDIKEIKKSVEKLHNR